MDNLLFPFSPFFSHPNTLSVRTLNSKLLLCWVFFFNYFENIITCFTIFNGYKRVLNFKVSLKIHLSHSIYTFSEINFTLGNYILSNNSDESWHLILFNRCALSLDPFVAIGAFKEVTSVNSLLRCKS